MGTVVILLILIAAVVFAWKGASKHLKGESCCGGRNDSYRPVKSLDYIIDRRKAEIMGIRCQHCQIKIKTALDQVPYLACQKIDDHCAEIVSSRMIDEQEIIRIIEKTGYHVKKMEKS